MLRFLTAGESHGKGLVTIIDNFPSGVKIDRDFIDEKLALRQSGYGRGARQKIETDKIEFLSGVRGSYTTGSPISFFIKNKDYENWVERMDIFKPVDEKNKIHIPRPGHADFAGSLKYNLDDIRNVLERSSARETASRVAVGAICQILLKGFGIEFASGVAGIGEVNACNYIDLFNEDILKNIKNSELRMPYPDLEARAKALIDKIKAEGDTIGGLIIAQVNNLPVGLGSFTQWDEKLDAHIAMSLMSIQAIKSVEIGLGIESGYVRGSRYQDSIYLNKNNDNYNEKNRRYFRKTDNAGGIEGGMSNGEIISVRCAMKPIPTLMKPYLDTVDLKTGEAEKAFLERSDVCAVPAASVVGEAALAFSVCYFFLKKFGGDSFEEIKRNYEGYIKS
ncbi:MAG: chorismate synthase [Deltaproteobacteria bacterium]|jgi:chorismate synthase|nr:chorismate synthase [Deltaproteobacteria bacterium]MCL5880339.1 chorismate synthase [Deltaproteobacteria bacterium]MDA8303622.1 chorismate synthase [Deltaproteobacteria bacterium]